MRYRHLAAVLCCALLLGLAACGKKGDLEHPEGTESV
jgi:predicted small lipoprotein YifL